MKRTTVWTIVALVGLYVMCQAIADVGATRMVSLADIIMPGGTFIFALTFTLRDLVHKRLGKEWARAAIVLAAVFNIMLALYLAGIARLAFPPFFAVGEAWNSIFAIVPAITVASILAELVSELIDTEVYHIWRENLPKWPQWTRVLASNAVSLPIDSVVFGVLAFTVLPVVFGGQVSPLGIAIRLSAGQIVWKAAVTLISMPVIYLVKDEPLEGIR